MTTLSAPILHSAAESDLGQSFVFLDTAIATVLAERFDVTAGGLVVNAGDFAGTGSDTARLRNIGGFGAAASMASMASETASISATAITAAYDTIAIGRYGLAYEESFTRAILANDTATLEMLAMTIGDSYLTTLRGLICTQGATFATNAANDAATLDVDDWINLVALAEQTEGFDGRLVAMLHPKQMSHLRSSWRAETALKFPDQFTAGQSLAASYGYSGDFLGVSIYKSTDVSLSGGDYYGFAYAPGAMAYAVGGTQNIGDLSDANAITVPQWGIVVTRATNGQQAIKRVDANAYVGVASRSATVSPQWLLRSNAT